MRRPSCECVAFVGLASAQGKKNLRPVPHLQEGGGIGRTRPYGRCRDKGLTIIAFSVS